MPGLSVFKEELLQGKDLAGFWQFPIKSAGKSDRDELWAMCAL